jgi:MFS family permease
MNEFKEKFGTCKNQPDRDDICAKDSALIVAILSVGTAIGALLAAPAGDMLGRRRSMLLAVGIFCIGAICQVCAEALPALLVGRWVFCFPSPNVILSTKTWIRTWFCGLLQAVQCH